MLVLGLDTATPASSVALVDVSGDGLTGIAERRTVDPRAHGERLAPEIAAVLAEAGVRPADLGAIVAGVGPGPYTGLRVGLATAASLGQALAIPTYGVCSLDGIGRAAGQGRVLVATDARRREVYFATYVDGVRATGPEVARPTDVAAILAAAGEGGLRELADGGSSLPGRAAGEGGLRERAGSGSLLPGRGAGETGLHERADGGSLLPGRGAGETGLHQRADGGSLLPGRGAGEGVLKYGDVFGLPVEEHLLYPPPAALIALAADRIRGGAPGEALTPLYLRRPDAVEPGGRKPVLT